MLKGLERLGSPMVPDAAFDGPVVELPEQRIAPGDGAVVVDLSLAAGLKFSAGAPQFIGVTAKDAGVVRIPPMEDQTVAFPLRVAIASKSGATTLSVDAAVYYCRTGAESLCYVRQIRFVVPVRVDATATGPDVRVAYQLREP